MRRLYIILLIVVLTTTNLRAQEKRQMRAAWIATVANIDWPARDCLTTEAQKRSMIEMLDSLKALNFNTIFFQVRPTADAFYDSQIEPWSIYLTGEQGREPSPYYDPLAFVIHEAHKRLMQVHVWINPYRLSNSLDVSKLSPNHLYFRRPYMFVHYGNQYLFNPALDETRDYLNKIVSDIVLRYDIDGVHMDDYFYPYRIKGEEFPDAQLFLIKNRGFNNIDDWRRDNVNLIIERLSKTIKEYKPWVEFGISPFGVWRNKSKDIRGSGTRAGQTNYDDLYADIVLWLEKGWIDYVVPQLYWEIGHSAADYAILLDWWSRYCYQHNLYIGLSSSNLGSAKAEAWHDCNELCRQLSLNEQYSEVKGAAFFSAHTLLENRQGLCDSLKNNFYKYPALLPINKNLRGGPTAAPKGAKIQRQGARRYLTWDEPFDAGGYAVDYYVVYKFDADESDYNFDDPANIFLMTKENYIDLEPYIDKLNKNTVFAITAINRFHYESLQSDYVEYTQTR